MTHECIEIEDEVKDLDNTINEIEKLYNLKYMDLRYYFDRLKTRHNILISNKNKEIQILKDIISEIETSEIKEKIDKEKINVHVRLYKILKTKTVISLSSDSKRRSLQYDENGRMWFIPKLKDDSYIKIRFIGKDGKKLDYRNDDEPMHIAGISSSSAIIGNTIFGRGSYKDIRDNFILDKRALSLLLIDPSVWIYTIHGTEDIGIIESSKDINTTLEII